MNVFRVLLTMICAAPLGACGVTTGASEGFSRLTPSPSTRAYIIKTDRPFAEQVAAHNQYGASQGLWK